MSARASLRRHARVILDTRRATDEDWERVRGMRVLGGADAAAAVGESAWDSPWTVWARHRGLLPPKPRTERMSWGLRLEPLILDAFGQETGLRVHPQHTLLLSRHHPWMVARLDALAEGDEGLAVVDAKATRGWDDGPTPDAWWQVQHYLLVTGLSVGWLAVLEAGNRLHCLRVPADGEAQAALVELESRLWRHIVDGTEPPIDGSDATREGLKLVHPTAAAEVVREMDASALALVRRRHELTVAIQALEEEREQAENRLRAWMGEAAAATLMGEPLVTYRNRATSRVDLVALRERHPRLVARYTRVGSTRALTFGRTP